MACHRAVVMAPGPGRMALYAASQPCRDEAEGGGQALAERVRTGTDCREGSTTRLGSQCQAARLGLTSKHSCSCLRFLISPLV